MVRKEQGCLRRAVPFVLALALAFLHACTTAPVQPAAALVVDGPEGAEATGRRTSVGIDEFLTRARAAYRQAIEAKAGKELSLTAPFELVDYPEKWALLTRAEASPDSELESRIAGGLNAITLDPGRYGLTGGPTWDEAFWIDLAAGLPDGRGLPLLLRYLDRDPPAPPGNLAAALAQAAPAGRAGDDLLWSGFEKASSWSARQAALGALRRRAALTASAIRERLFAPGLPLEARLHLVEALRLLPGKRAAEWEGWFEAYEEAGQRLPPEEARAFRRRLAEAWPWGAPAEVRRRLGELAQAASDPPLRQRLLARLWQEGREERWLAALAAEVEAHGWQAGVPHWELLRTLVERRPKGRLAAGVRLYEQVRGLPYFAWDRRDESIYWLMSLGDEQYRPEEEIPGWHAFLERFPDHPGADDAAYRLGRCLEIQGDYPGALAAFYRALELPDGDLRFAAYGRILHLLDTLRAEEFQAFHPWPEGLPEELRWPVAYGEAVALLREGRYAEAADALGRLLEGQEEPDSLRPALFALRPTAMDGGYPLGAMLDRQRASARALAELAQAAEAASSPEDGARARYELAARIYHDPYLFYNHLWAGKRQAFYWLGGVNAHLYGALTARFRDYVRRSHHLAQALPMLEALAGPDAPPALRARALFSVGRAYTELLSAAEEAQVLFPPEELRRRAAAALEGFLALKPRDPLADDALLMLAAVTRERRYLEELVARFPQSELRGRAEQLLQEGLPCVGTARLPFGRVRPGDPSVPDAVWTALAELREGGQPGHRLIQAGEGTYLVVFRPGEVIRIDALWQAGPDQIGFRVEAGEWARQVRRVVGTATDPDSEVVWIPFPLRSASGEADWPAGGACP